MVDVVTTPASATANSYLSIDEADTFADTDIGTYAEAWRASGDADQKARALIRATRDIDRYVGRVAASYVVGQALVFPRNLDLVDEVPIIPTGLKHATYLQAVYLFSEAETIDKASTQRARGLSSFAEPNVSGSLVTDGSYLLAPTVDAALLEYREGSVVGWIRTT